MKIAYLILVHNTPNHTKRLVSALSSNDAHIFIHLDKKVNCAEYHGLVGDNVHFISQRIPVHWGDFSQVEAILNLLRMAMAQKPSFDRFVLLSGSDFPLRSTDYIEHFFNKHKGQEFINLVEMPSIIANKPLSRLTRYEPRVNGYNAGKFRRLFLKTCGSLLRLLRRDYKKAIGNMNPYAGSEWWALSREACDYVFNFISERPYFFEFYKNTVVPDESFFQTIIGNSAISCNVARNLTFTDWSHGGSSPENVTEKHIAHLKAVRTFPASDVYGPGEILFARKFTDDSEELVGKIQRDLW